MPTLLAPGRLMQAQKRKYSALDSYGRAAFLFDKPAGIYRNGASEVADLSLLAGLTFTRALAAYAPNSAGVLQLFGSGVPRITDRGLLIEGARTNLCLRSQEFDNGVFVVSRILAFGSGSIVDATAAPDGTLTADKVVEDTTATNTHSILQSFTKAASATTYTATIFAKAAERSAFQLQVYGATTSDRGAAFFDLATGTISVAAVAAGTFTSASATITAFANGWYRCSVTVTSDTATNLSIRVFLGDTPTNNSYTGNGTSGLYLWGAQLEAAAFPSSYIPTTSASVARPADVCSIAVSGFVYPATLFAEFERVVDTGGNEILLHISNNSVTERAQIYVEGASTDTFTCLVTAGGASQAQESVSGALAVGTVYRGAARVGANDVKAARGGTLSSGDTTVTAPTAPTLINIGASQTNLAQPFGFLKRAAVWSNLAFIDAQEIAVSS